MSLIKKFIHILFKTKESTTRDEFKIDYDINNIRMSAR